MKTNLFILLLLLTLCAVVGTQYRASTPAHSLTLELLPVDFQNEDIELTEPLLQRTTDVIRKRLENAGIPFTTITPKKDSFQVLIGFANDSDRDGNFTQSEATLMANYLNSGALEVKLQVIDSAD